MTSSSSGGLRGGAAATAGICGRVLGRQRLGDALERLALGLDAEERLDETAPDHQRGTDVVADRDLGDVHAGCGLVDEVSEEERARDTAGRGPDGVEERDAQ